MNKNICRSIWMTFCFLPVCDCGLFLWFGQSVADLALSLCCNDTRDKLVAGPCSSNCWVSLCWHYWTKVDMTERCLMSDNRARMLSDILGQHKMGQNGTIRRAQWLRGRASDSWLWKPGFESCAAVLKPLASFFHSTLLQFTQLYKWVPGYRQWWICVRAAFTH